MRPYLILTMLSTTVALLPAHAQAQTAAPGAPPATASPSSLPSSQGGSSIDLAATRILSDPLYLPLKGQVYGATAYTLGLPKGDNLKAGVNTGSFTSSDNLVDQTFAYGLLNDLTIRVTQGYGINNRDSTSAATGDVTTGSASGFNDPTISATFRVLDEPRSPVILNLTAFYSPDAFAAEASGGGSDGTIARGGQTAGISFALGRVTKSFTVAATAASTHVGPQLTELLSNGTSSSSDAYWSYNLGFTTQTRFADRWSFDAGVAFATAGHYDVSNIETGSSVTYSYNSYSDATNTFAKASFDTVVANHTGNVVGVRLLYVFN